MNNFIKWVVGLMLFTLGLYTLITTTINSYQLRPFLSELLNYIGAILLLISGFFLIPKTFKLINKKDKFNRKFKVRLIIASFLSAFLCLTFSVLYNVYYSISTPLKNSKSKLFKNNFIGEVWIIDSITTKLPDGKKYFTPSKQILKAKSDSTFGVYREQTNQFKKYYFKNDSIFLNKVNSKFWNPFKYEVLNDNEVKLKSDNNLDFRISLTNITDLFQGKIDNSNSKLYQKLYKKVWYPIYFKVGNSVRYDDKDRYTENSYYLKEHAFILNNDKATFPFIDGTENDRYYRFKYTHKGLYIYDTDAKQLVLALQAKFEDKGGRDYLTLVGNLGFAKFRMELKEIDPVMLKSINELSKNERLGCNEFTAEDSLKSFLKEKSNNTIYYDTSKIKLVNEDRKNCSYDFTVKEISKEIPSLYTNEVFRITFINDGSFRINKL